MSGGKGNTEDERLTSQAQSAGGSRRDSGDHVGRSLLLSGLLSVCA